MMQKYLRNLHRYAGLLFAPFIFLQTISGLVLTFGVFRQVDETLADAAPEAVSSTWNVLILGMHYGPGTIGWIYHSLIGLALLWLIVSGVWMWTDSFLRKKRAEKQKQDS